MSSRVKYPGTALLAKSAFEASKCATHQDFVDMLGGAIGLRTFRAWLAGERPAALVAKLMLQAITEGWRPSESWRPSKAGLE